MSKVKKQKTVKKDENLIQVQTGNIDLLTIQLLSEINQKMTSLLTYFKDQKNG